MNETRGAEDRRPENASDRLAGPPRICILGVYGKGNLGDEVLLCAIVDEIRSRLPGARLVTLCSNPDAVAREHGIEALSRSPSHGFLAKLRLLRGCDLLLLGSGTMLCDGRNWIQDLTSASATLLWPRLARLFRIPVMAYGQGLGPATHLVMRRAIRAGFARLDAVALRDGRSLRLLTEIAGELPHATLTCDPAVSSRRFDPDRVLAGTPREVRERIRSLSPYTVVALKRPPTRESADAFRDFYSEVGRAAAGFHGRTGSRLVLLPIAISDDYPDDRDVVALLKPSLRAHGVPEEAVIETGWESWDEAVSWLQCADLVLSSRLHGIVLAARSGAALVGLAHQEKIKGCMKMIGEGPACRVLDARQLDADRAAEVLTAAWSARAESRETIRAGVERWAGRRPSNLDTLLALLSRGRGETG